MKFNINDKVVVMDFTYFSNPFHWQKCMKFYTVQDANENFFTFLQNKLDPYFSGSNEYSIYYQTSARPMWGNEKAYHVEKDADIINKMIQDRLNEFHAEAKADQQKRIGEMEKTIEAIKLRLEKLKSGPLTVEILSNEHLVTAWESRFLNYIKKDFVYTEKKDE